jgi:hypothetical protein
MEETRREGQNFSEVVVPQAEEEEILRKIFGPLNIDSVRRIRNNMEIDNLIEGADIVRFINAQRIKWLRHIQQMKQARPTRKLETYGN